MQVESNPTTDLYEIPHCTICLNELTEDLSNLNCGHVFHLPCISQHFAYRGTCPNCQKRSHQKEIRAVVFPLQKNTQTARLMREVVGNLSVEEKNQVQELFKVVQTLTEKNEKLQNKCSQAEKQSKKSTTELNNAKTSLNRTKIELQTMKNDCLQLRKVVDHFQNEVKNAKDQVFNLTQQLIACKEREAEVEQFKKYRKHMYDNAQQLLNHKNEMIKKGASPIDLANQFFDILLIRNVEYQKLRRKLEGLPEQLMQKDQEITKLKNNLQSVKKETKQNRQKLAVEKKKYDDLKQRYKQLIEKYKAKCQELSDDDNYEDSMMSRPSFPLVPPNNLNKKNSSGNGFASIQLNENSSSNIPFPDAKINKKSSENVLSMIEEEPKGNMKKIQLQKKSAVQKSLNNFFPPASQISLMSYGGVKPKIKVEDTKKPRPVLNLFQKAD